jgi:hypothetical protein
MFIPLLSAVKPRFSSIVPVLVAVAKAVLSVPVLGLAVFAFVVTFLAAEFMFFGVSPADIG